MTARRLPQWLLERVALSELPPSLPEATRARLEEAGDQKAVLSSLEEQNRAFLQSHPPQGFARAVRARLEAQRPRAPSALWPLLAVAVPAAVGLALLIPAPAELSADGDRSGVRTKSGKPMLRVFRQTASGSEELSDGAAARPGDVLQLRYSTFGRRYGAVLSVDGLGQITVHQPLDGKGPAALQPSGEIALPRAFRLDAAPGFERFILVTSERPFELQAVVDESRRAPEAATLPLPDTFEQQSLTLIKDGK